MRVDHSSRRGVTRRDAVACCVLTVLVAGLIPTAMMKAQQNDNGKKAINNLRQIGLCFHSYNDINGYLPYNGGHTNPDKLKSINYGWHTAKIPESGTWATMILEYMEQDPLRRANVLTGTAVDKVPEELTDADKFKLWNVSIKSYLCPERNRVGFKTGTDNGAMPGIVTDYAVNVFINDPPFTYTFGGKPVENSFATSGGLACKENSRMTIQGMQDGSSNTILAGQKAMSKAMIDSKEANSGDEGIFSPGHYSPKDKVVKAEPGNGVVPPSSTTSTKRSTTVASTGTARGHRVDPNIKATTDQAMMPKDGGVPWIYKDSDLTGKELPDFGSDWGSPFTKGSLFLMGDGVVRTINFKVNGTVNFARMLYPSDGAVVRFE